MPGHICSETRVMAVAPSLSDDSLTTGEMLIVIRIKPSGVKPEILPHSQGLVLTLFTYGNLICRPSASKTEFILPGDLMKCRGFLVSSQFTEIKSRLDHTGDSQLPPEPSKTGGPQVHRGHQQEKNSITSKWRYRISIDHDLCAIM